MKPAHKFTRRDGLFFSACCAAFAASAMYLNAYGPDAPLMMAWFGIDSAQQGLLLALQSSGGCIAAVFLALKGEQFNKATGVAVGLLILGAGCMLMGVAPEYGVMLLLAAVSGFGFTIVDVLVNGVLSDTYPARKNTLVPVAHAFYGVGGMVAPILVAGTVKSIAPVTFGVPFTMIGIICVVLFALYAGSAKAVEPWSPYTRMEEKKALAARNPAEIFKEKSSWILIAAGILYFSFQLAVSSWLPTFCLERGIPFDTSSLMLSGFYGGALAMTFLSALLLRRFTARRLFGSFGLASSAVMAAALFQSDSAVLMVLTIVSGFCQGVGVVTLILVAVDAFPHRSASASSIQVVSANIGAITAPLWVGAMAERTGFQIPLLLTCFMYAAGCILVLLFAPRPAQRQDSSLQT